MNHLTKPAIAMAFMLATSMLAVTSSASANWARVRIDNLHSDGWIHAKSIHPITVSIRYTSTGAWTSETRVMNFVDWDHDFIFDTGSLDAYDIYEIRVAIGWTSYDMFVVDQILLYDSVNFLVDYDGGDNNLGWCFSAEAGDELEPHCYQSKKYLYKDFRMQY